MSLMGHKQTLGPTRFHVCYALIGRHGTGFTIDDGDGTRPEADRRRSRTNPEKRGVPDPNIREIHAPHTKFEIFFGIFAGKLPPAQKLKFFHIN
jgi:hypothetical protein